MAPAHVIRLTTRLRSSHRNDTYDLVDNGSLSAEC